MSDPHTVRILSLDGGGMRGYMSLIFLQRFLQEANIDEADIWKKFDVIAGTSIGGISALRLAFGLTPTEMLPLFTTQGKYIFSLSPVIASLRPNVALKIALIIANTPFYASLGSSYGIGLLRATLDTQFSTNTIQNLKANVIIPSYEADTNTYVLFSNLNYAEFIGRDELIRDIALATSAAPAYLPTHSIGSHLYDDGGIYLNTPAEFGKTLAQILKPNATRCCILSLGTGIGQMGFDSGIPDNPLDPSAPVTTIEKIFSLYKWQPQALKNL